MTRVAAVDLGTNTVRLLVADVEDGRIEEVHRETRIIRLGEGVDAGRQLLPAPMGRAFRIQKRKAHVTVHVSDEVKPVNQRSEGKGARSAPARGRARK